MSVQVIVQSVISDLHPEKSWVFITLHDITVLRGIEDFRGPKCLKIGKMISLDVTILKHVSFNMYHHSIFKILRNILIQVYVPIVYHVTWTTEMLKNWVKADSCALCSSALPLRAFQFFFWDMKLVTSTTLK